MRVAHSISRHIHIFRRYRSYIRRAPNNRRIKRRGGNRYLWQRVRKRPNRQLAISIRHPGPDRRRAQRVLASPARAYISGRQIQKGAALRHGVQGRTARRGGGDVREMPEHLRAYCPPSEVTACREKLTVKGSAQHQALEAIEKFIRGGE